MVVNGCEWCYRVRLNASLYKKNNIRYVCVNVPEWLTGGPAKAVGFSRASSNLVVHELSSFCFYIETCDGLLFVLL